MHYITESLLVGNIEDARRPPAFIRSLLFLAEEHRVPAPPGVRFERIPLKEYGEADPVSVLQAVSWMEREAADGKVMVCCRAGMGRSVSMVIAYLCCVGSMPYTEAVNLLTARRPGATPLPNLEATIEKVRTLRQSGAGAQPGPGDRRH